MNLLSLCLPDEEFPSHGHELQNLFNVQVERVGESARADSIRHETLKHLTMQLRFLAINLYGLTFAPAPATDVLDRVVILPAGENPKVTTAPYHRRD